MCIGTAKMGASFENSQLSGQKKEQSKITALLSLVGGGACPVLRLSQKAVGRGWVGGSGRGKEVES